MVTLKTLVDDPDLGLRVVTGQDPAGIEVAWAHVSELRDPTEFLTGGEFLLVTGVNLPRGRSGLVPYVQRLVDTGVSALGFGVGVTRKAVPALLLEACREYGLPLVEIARAVPFLAITRAMAAAAAEEESRDRAFVHNAQRRLTATVVESGDVRPMVEGLARLLGGWTLLLDRTTAVVAAGGCDDERRAGLGEEIDRIASRQGTASLLTRSGEDEVWLQSLAAGREAVGYLIVGRSTPLATRERQLVNASVPLLILAISRAGTESQQRLRLETAVLRLLLAGEHELVADTADALWNGLPSEPVRVLRVTAPTRRLEGLRSRVADAVSSSRVLLGLVDEALVLLTPDGGRPEAAALAALADQPGVRVGVSAAIGLDEVDRGLAQARRAADVAHDGEPLRFDDLPPVGLLSLVPAETAREFAEGRLRPLQEARGDLIASLRAWLEHHGQWDPAAGALGVHRHTLRNRIQKAEALLGRRLDSADHRAELWLALQLMDRDETSTGQSG